MLCVGVYSGLPCNNCNKLPSCAGSPPGPLPIRDAKRLATEKVTITRREPFNISRVAVDSISFAYLPMYYSILLCVMRRGTKRDTMPR